jgi:RNA methyltransferase, TrmH family
MGRRIGVSHLSSPLGLAAGQQFASRGITGTAIVTSLSNPAVKQVRALQQRKERDRSGTFFIEGIRIVAEAIQTGAEIETVVIAPDLLKSAFARSIVSDLRGKVRLLEVSAPVFESLSRKEGPQGLGAVVRQRWQPLRDVYASGNVTWVALDAVQDPGNLGTILRTCDATGAEGVVLLGSTVDPYDPSALRASMGAIFTRRLARATWTELFAWSRRERCQIVGTSGQAETEFRRLKYPGRLVLLMGSERAGLAPEQQAACDHLVRIPMAGHADSLNLAVATGVILYEVFEQQRGSVPVI